MTCFSSSVKWAEGQPKRVVIKIKVENGCEALSTEFGIRIAGELWHQEAWEMLW